eukprot:TRINITY_DN2567_c0_g1_i4.p1 TRINITY_DN2567_c0_g1~~TRINITY_DN2567_c0_g1_i4.p1  ORF type:complete len:305 (-),score=50.29 TRINITY_DN2567_c0_g1_i4:20-898(-)
MKSIITLNTNRPSHHNNLIQQKRKYTQSSPKTKWDHTQYTQFKAQRDQPFHDLLNMVHTDETIFRLLDLGCGDGRLTQIAHEQFKCYSTLGVDSSSEMLKIAKESEKYPYTEFMEKDIVSALKDMKGRQYYDLVMSNAALHWVYDHKALFKLIDNVVECKSGQVAIQIPCNNNHVSHSLISEIVMKPKYVKYLDNVYRSPVLEPEEYLQILHNLGYKRYKAYVNVYPHLLKNAGEMAQWTKGSVLSYYRDMFPEEVFEQFYDEYATTLVKRVDDSSPFLYTFKRVFIWGSKR